MPFGPCVEESCPTVQPPTDVWTKVPPAGWDVDRTGVPGVGDATQGAEEWEGWTFALKDWWVYTAGDQDRSLFTNGTGIVAVADADEWDDLGNPDQSGAATFNSFLTTPAIPIGTATANSLTLKFDSSWRHEDNQTATVTVAFDGGAAIEVLRWESPDASPYLHLDNTNETVQIPLNNAAGATSMVIKFGLTNAINNWFWTIDNIVITDGVTPLFSEDFESLTLGPRVSSSEKDFPPAADPTVWTDVPPTGWTVDDTHVPGYETAIAGTLEDNDGRTEWAGWSFPTITWWPTVDDQLRSTFTKATGGVAVADPDEWDDQPHPSAATGFENEPGFYAFMWTPEVNVKGVQPRNLYVAFDSSWRAEDPPYSNGRQTALIEVSYDGGELMPAMRWANYPGWPEGTPGDPDFKPDATNESVLVPLGNPRANTAKIRFGLTQAGNDWWWAIDNVVVFALKPGSDPSFDFDADGDVDQSDFGLMQPCFDPMNPLTSSSSELCLRADYDLNLFVDQADYERFLACLSGPGIPADPTCDD